MTMFYEGEPTFTFDTEEDYNNFKKKELMQIQILSVTPGAHPTKTGKTTPVIELAFKNLSFGGKVEGKKLFSFGANEAAYKALKEAMSGEVFEVGVTKNAAGFNDWVSAVKGGAPVADVGTQPAPDTKYGSKGATVSPRNTYETPEERARKQVYIVRQSSISGAVSTLSVGAKKLDPDEVLALAKRYEDYVFGKPSTGATGFDDLPDFDDEAFKEPQ